MKAPTQVTNSQEREQARMVLVTTQAALNVCAQIIADNFSLETVFDSSVSREIMNLEEMARAYDCLQAFDAGENDDPGLNVICYWLVVSHNDEEWLEDAYSRRVRQLLSPGMDNLNILNAILGRYGRKLVVASATVKPKAPRRRSSQVASV